MTAVAYKQGRVIIEVEILQVKMGDDMSTWCTSWREETHPGGKSAIQSSLEGSFTNTR